MSATTTTRSDEDKDGLITRLLEVQGPCTTPLDAALEYCRVRADRVLPMYILAMTPHAIVTILLIDAVIAGHRSSVVTYCIWLTGAMVWRWVWLARLQYNVQHELRDLRNMQFWAKVPAILYLRLLSNVAITWGSLLVGVPAFYGLFVGGFAAPLLLESRTSAATRLKECISWINFTAKRLFRVSMVMTVITIIGIIAVFVSQAALVGTVLPSLLGVDTADLNITLGSWAWRLRVFYFLFLLIDVYWAVACVFLYYDSQSRRMAADLRVRLANVTEVSA